MSALVINAGVGASLEMNKFIQDYKTENQ